MFICLSNYNVLVASNIIYDITNPPSGYKKASPDFSKDNDYPAFQDLSKFIRIFNQQKNAGSTLLIIIPKGNYELDPFITNSTVSKAAIALYKINHINIRIQGEAGIDGIPLSKISFKENLKFGKFDDKVWSPGSIIDIDQCNYGRQIEILQMEFYGCQGNYNYGGFSNYDKGIASIPGCATCPNTYQLVNYGIKVLDSRNILVDRLNIHHFGTDGMIVQNSMDMQASEKESDQIFIKNSKFEYNGRQGFSWAGGNGLSILNCEFNFTGKSKFHDPPSSGIDIEPNQPILSQGKMYYFSCSNGFFSNCKSVDNFGTALMIVNAENAPVKNMIFENCLFHDVDRNVGSACLNVAGINLIFKNNCKFYGTVYASNSSKTESNSTQFINCIFNDLPYKGQYMNCAHYLVISSSGNLRFDRCTFSLESKFDRNTASSFFDLKNNTQLLYQISNCTFILNKNYKSPYWVGDNKYYFNTIVGCRFIGVNKFLNNSESDQEIPILNKRVQFANSFKKNVNLSRNFQWKAIE